MDRIGFGIEKYAMLVRHKGKTEAGEGVELFNKQIIIALGRIGNIGSGLNNVE